MTIEEKQLLLKDLCSRLPYGVKVHIINANGVEIDDELTTSTISHLDRWIVKPYLHPMSSMTEEEQQKYYDLTHQEEDDIWGKCLFDKMVDFCNENHLDFRGLIPMGLALEAPKNMY